MNKLICFMIMLPCGLVLAETSLRAELVESSVVVAALSLVEGSVMVEPSVVVGAVEVVKALLLDAPPLRDVGALELLVASLMCAGSVVFVLVKGLALNVCSVADKLPIPVDVFAILV